MWNSSFADVVPHANAKVWPAPSLSDDGMVSETDTFAPADTLPDHCAVVGTEADATTPAFENTVP